VTPILVSFWHVCHHHGSRLESQHLNKKNKSFAPTTTLLFPSKFADSSYFSTFERLVIKVTDPVIFSIVTIGTVISFTKDVASLVINGAKTTATDFTHKATTAIVVHAASAAGTVTSQATSLVGVGACLHFKAHRAEELAMLEFLATGIREEVVPLLNQVRVDLIPAIVNVSDNVAKAALFVGIMARECGSVVADYRTILRAKHPDIFSGDFADEFAVQDEPIGVYYYPNNVEIAEIED
jgi:hypothetical protein